MAINEENCLNSLGFMARMFNEGKGYRKDVFKA
jgi:hypothetical protein